MSASTSVYILNPDGERLAMVGGGAGAGKSDFLALTYTSSVNASGRASIELRAGQLPAWLSVAVDWQLEITRSTSPALPERIEHGTRWFVRRLNENIARGTLTLSAESALGILGTRDVAYTAGSAQATKSGAADDLIKAIARENLGTLAASDRQIATSLLSIQADSSQAPTIAKSFSRRNVLTVCQEIAAAATQAGSFVAFDVVAAGSALELRTYLGQRGVDRSLTGISPLVIEADALGEASLDFDFSDEATAIYAAGQGIEAARDVEVRVSAAAGRSPWARRETTLSATNVAQGNLAALGNEAERGLWERRARQRLSATITETPQLRYGIDWDWGDRVTVAIGTRTWAVRVDQCTVSIANGVERVTATVRVEQ